jgi:outer membrane protein TolC
VLDRVELYYPKLAGVEVERRISRAKRLEKQGAFDPSVNAYSDLIRFNSTSKRGDAKLGTDNELTLDFLTRSGVKVSTGARLNLGDIKSPGSPTGDAGQYFIGLKVPLLRGFMLNDKSAAERQALLGEPLADADFFYNRLQILLNASASYWDWVANKRKVDVAQNILNIAKFRADTVQERVRAGDLPSIDAVEANQEVMRRQGALVKAQRDLQKATFKLSLYLWEANRTPSPLPPPEQVPSEWRLPVPFSGEEVRLGYLLAGERRPELRAIAIERKINQVDFDLARNMALPALDLSVEPGYDAGGGGIGPTIKAAVGVSVPLRQRAARGRAEQAKLKIEKLNLEEQQTRQEIAVEVTDAVSAINTAYERFEAAQREVQLAREMEQGERIRFNLGDSTLFLVNQRERATAEAEFKLIEVQADYEQAVATFRAVTGQL